MMAAALISSLPFFSCNKQNEPLKTGFLNGIYVVNEGGYNNSNASITYYDRDSAQVHKQLFAKANGRDLGDVAQSFAVAGDLGLIVVNNSQKVEVVDLETFISVGTITGMDYPRYALQVTADKAYITDGNYAGNVYVVNLNTLEIDGEIPVGKGPENIVRAADLIYVANSGGWDSDSTVSVIDPQGDVVVKTITVGDHPTDLAVDADLNVWVLCKGKVLYDNNWNVIGETDSRLVKINTIDFSSDKIFIVGVTGDFFNPVRLTAGKDGTYLFYAEAGGIYKMGINDTSTPGQAFIPGSFYGLEVDPDTGNVLALKANGFDAGGRAYIYTFEGRLVDSLDVGIAPNGAAFN